MTSWSATLGAVRSSVVRLLNSRAMFGVEAVVAAISMVLFVLSCRDSGEQFFPLAAAGLVILTVMEGLRALLRKR